jgi:transposase
VAFAARTERVDPRRFVFLDETAVQSDLIRRYGRSPQGTRCLDYAPAGHFTTSTLLGALRLTGPIEGATLLLDGTVNAEVFTAYLERVLAPRLRPRDIVVLDNLSAHKGAATERAIRARGAHLAYLPPYSPDLNPIEKLFAKLKAGLRRVAARHFAPIARATRQILRTVTPQESLHYFQSCGYALRTAKVL